MKPEQQPQCDQPPADYSGLRAILLNCSLKPSPSRSHTQGLMDVCKAIMESQGVAVQVVRVADYDLPPGIQPDMTEEGFARDDWPALSSEVLGADIAVLGTPIWLGEKSSVCTRLIERLYALSGKTNERGQSIYYGRVAGCVITGNEDGAKHCGRDILYAMQHLGYVIPPQADTYWLGEAGPGPSYLDEDSGGPSNEFTQRNTTFMTWNLLHLARMIKDTGGIPAYGNQPKRWKDGCRFLHPAAGR